MLRAEARRADRNGLDALARYKTAAAELLEGLVHAEVVPVEGDVPADAVETVGIRAEDAAPEAEDHVAVDLPEGHIWIDLAPILLDQASMSQVLGIANRAMNRLTLRDWVEIFHEVGLSMSMNLVAKTEEAPKGG
jgi:hypothetical protein